MRYHALNCPDKPGQPQNLPGWAKALDPGIVAALDVVHRARLFRELADERL